MQAHPSHRYPASAPFGELGGFDFCGGGRGRVVLQLGAFSLEKGTDNRVVSGVLDPGGMYLGAPKTQQSANTKDTSPAELDSVYVMFARSRDVNNFVARMHALHKHDALNALCSNASSWLRSEFVAPISSLRRLPPAKVEQGKMQIIKPAAGLATTEMEKRGPQAASADITNRPAPAAAPALARGVSLLAREQKAKDLFLAEYGWEWQVEQGGEYSVVIANCAAATIQLKYNLVMANQWSDGQWTNLPAGWMPVQQAYPTVCYTLWAAAAGCWVMVQLRCRRAVKPALSVLLGVVPLLRFLSCFADQSRYALWGSGSYEVTMIVVSTSLVGALADGAHFLVILALGKGWGIVRSRLVGTEKRLVFGQAVFIATSSLYNGATRGGGILGVGVMQMVAVAYTWACLAHTRRVHAVHTLRLARRNQRALMEWYSRIPESRSIQNRADGSTIGGAAGAADEPLLGRSLRHLAVRRWAKVAEECASNRTHLETMALLWSATHKERLLKLAYFAVLPLQTLDLAVLFAGSFAVPAHHAYIGLILAQTAHWVAFMSAFAALLAGGLELPDVQLPAIPSIATRRSLPPPPVGASSASPRPLPPLGALRLFGRSASLGSTAL
ncbi:hypothetical protein GGI12_002068 [Dipsacomyces acuminosporus]|nr:hypothetical protein GGI12_002068 [Dipsacomyces acuminosporus]